MCVNETSCKPAGRRVDVEGLVTCCRTITPVRALEVRSKYGKSCEYQSLDPTPRG